jgi:hypothetical protein
MNSLLGSQRLLIVATVVVAAMLGASVRGATEQYAAKPSADVPTFNKDFNWQTSYIFATPLKLPKGTKIQAIAHYDNSAANTSNPDPNADVTWGDQTWEELMFSSIVFSIDGVSPGAVMTSNGGQ